MFASLMGNSGNGQNTQKDDEQEDKKTVKVGELNYLYDQEKMLLVKITTSLSLRVISVISLVSTAQLWSLILVNSQSELLNTLIFLNH